MWLRHPGLLNDWRQTGYTGISGIYWSQFARFPTLATITLPHSTFLQSHSSVSSLPHPPLLTLQWTESFQEYFLEIFMNSEHWEKGEIERGNEKRDREWERETERERKTEKMCPKSDCVKECVKEPTEHTSFHYCTNPTWLSLNALFLKK